MSSPKRPLDRPRACLGETKSTASDDEREEKALKDRERERVWAAATTLRETYVNFVVPRTFTENGMEGACQTTAAYFWQEDKVGEKHRVFLMSCDLLHESGGQRGQGRRSGRRDWDGMPANSCCPRMAMPICSSSAMGGPVHAARHSIVPQQMLATRANSG